MNTPLSIEFLASADNTPVSGAYPYSLKGRDLDKNFVFATLDVDESLIEQTTGQGGHLARKLKIPAVPEDGTHVLGAVGGVMQWIATEECD